MKKVVLNYLVIAALAVAAAFTSCKKEVIDAGVLTINGKEFPLTGASMCVLKNFDEGTETIRSINFEYINGRSIFFIMMNAGVSKLESKTYTTSEIANLTIIAFVVDGMQSSYNYDDDDVVMKVDVKGETYTITINGRATQYKTEAEYSVTYRGKIFEEQCDGFNSH